MKYYLYIFLSLIFFLSSSGILHAQEIVTRIPIVQDTYIESVKFDEIHGSLQTLLLGFANTWREGLARTYVRYEVSEFHDIGMDSVVSATLNMYQQRINTDFPYEIMVGRVINPWSEDTLMWTPYAPNDYEALEHREIPQHLGWKSIDITNIFKNHLENPESNYGVVLLMVDEEARGGAFWSKDCILFTTLCTAELFPYVEVVYEKAEEVVEEEEDEQEEEDDENEESDIEEDVNTPTENSNDDDNDDTGSSKDKEDSVVKEVSENTTSIQTTVENRVFAPIQTDILEDMQLESNSISVLGSSEIVGATSDKVVCRYRYHTKDKTMSKVQCSIAQPKILSGTSKYGSMGNSIEAEIAMPKSIEIILDRVSCLKPTLTNPITIIKCIEFVSDSETIKSSTPYIDIQILLDGKWVNTQKKQTEKGFKVTSNGYSKPKSLSITARYRIDFSKKIKEGAWIDVIEVSKNSHTFKLKELKAPLPPYVFPHLKIVNVTQWHGKTAYSKDHTGMDFESNFIPTVAISNGTVDFIGWDGNSGKCLSGGNYIKLKHSDGRYSLYLHLNSFTKGLKKGSTVKKGQVIGVSGRSGFFNCENLSAHLHFEIRNGASQRTHTNPVPLINTDWSKVKTARANVYPGRLSGDNPHPTF